MNSEMYIAISDGGKVQEMNQQDALVSLYRGHAERVLVVTNSNGHIVWKVITIREEMPT